MADVRPFNALHYDPERVAIADVTAPPYDVIDAAGRVELLSRSDRNVVELDLPRTDDGSNIYRHAAEMLEAWRADGTLVDDDRQTFWALEQDYIDSDGSRRTRRGFMARIGVTGYGPGLVRPHERTQPGPKLDRLELTRATRHNLSPIFVLHPGDAWSLIARRASEADLLNVALFGKTALQWRSENPDSKGNIRDQATLEQLVVLSNLESINAVLIHQGLSQPERLVQLNQIAISQMKSLIHHSTIQQLKK